jgi:hypothetical protein
MISSSSKFIIDLSLGKPGVYGERSLQSGAKGHSCLYYAFKRLGVIFGPEEKAYRRDLAKGALNAQISYLGKDLQKLYSQLSTGNALPSNFEALPSEHKVGVTTLLVHYKLFANSHLAISKWAPSHQISNLKCALQACGPLVVSGRFGGVRYKTAAKQIDSFADRNIWGWGKEARQWVSPLLHAVVVVGMEVDTENVFYIDPNDPSDPKNPETQKIYRIPYALFCESTFDYSGSKDFLFGFAVYNPKFLTKMNFSLILST